jgi:endonuclease/exonuclease/phosphatase family metal-dependent hydrolase
MKDRDVILVNTRTKGLSYDKKSVTSGRYKAQQEFTVAGQTVSFSRGYVYLDMTYKGSEFRFANTHLEVGGDAAPIQEKQGKEFVKVVKKGADTAIAMGDFNTDAYGLYSPKTYQILTRSYFSDAWKPKRDGKGLTCCQNDALSNPISENVTRIDLVLTHGKVKSTGSVNTNVTPFREAPVPLWESDHGGVVTELKVS